MSFLRLDDAFPEHPKVHPLTDKAFRLHVHALCYCARNLTDGIISKPALRMVLASCDAKPRHVLELIAHRLWHPEDAGKHRIHDYLEKNPTAAEVQQIKAARAEAGRIGGTRSGQARRQANASANAQADPSKQNGKQAGSTPSHPIRDTQEGFALDATRQTALQRLVAAAGGGPETASKVMRSIGFPPPSEDDLEHVIRCATGKNVRDPLAVTLSELAKLRRTA